MKKILVIFIMLLFVISGCTISHNANNEEGSREDRTNSVSLEQVIFESGIMNVIHTVEKEDYSIVFAYDNNNEEGKFVIAKYSKHDDEKWYYHGNSGFSSVIELPTVYVSSMWVEDEDRYIVVHAGVVNHPDLSKVIIEETNRKVEASFAEKDNTKIWYHIEETKEQQEYLADRVIAYAKDGKVLYESAR